MRPTKSPAPGKALRIQRLVAIGGGVTGRANEGERRGANNLLPGLRALFRPRRGRFDHGPMRGKSAVHFLSAKTTAMPLLRLLTPILAAFAATLAGPSLAATDEGLPAFMAGTWMMEDGAEWSDELWSDAKGNLMLGVARSGFGSEVKSWEMARIERKADGSISYFAQPKGAAPTEFRQALRSADAVEFANAANDFPQRIRYWRQGQLLMAEISKLDGSGAVRWNYRPVIPPRDDAGRAPTTLPSAD